MSTRVQLDSTKGLRISAPGFNAATAELNQLFFSPDYKMRRSILTGAYYVGSEGWHTVFFGQSFARRPYSKFSVYSDDWQNVDIKYGPVELLVNKVVPVSPTSNVSNILYNWTTIIIAPDRWYTFGDFSDTGFFTLRATVYYEISREV